MNQCVELYQLMNEWNALCKSLSELMLYWYRIKLELVWAKQQEITKDDRMTIKIVKDGPMTIKIVKDGSMTIKIAHAHLHHLHNIPAYIYI
jgi:hypothetical protein